MGRNFGVDGGFTLWQGVAQQGKAALAQHNAFLNIAQGDSGNNLFQETIGAIEIAHGML